MRRSISPVSSYLRDHREAVSTTVERLKVLADILPADSLIRRAALALISEHDAGRFAPPAEGKGLHVGPCQ